MPAALLGALGTGQLAAHPAPARAAQTLPVHTHTVVGARRVQAIHCSRGQKPCTERVTSHKGMCGKRAPKSALSIEQIEGVLQVILIAGLRMGKRSNLHFTLNKSSRV